MSTATPPTETTRERMLQAAGQVFADLGYQAATVRDICQAANVNVASVNYYFRDKEGLYFEAVHHARLWIVEKNPLPIWPVETPPQQKLHEFIQTIVRRLIGTASSPWQTRLLLRELMHPTASCEEMVREHFRPHFNVLLSILGELLPAETSLTRRRQVAFSIFGQCVYYRIAGELVSLLIPADELKRNFTPDQLARHIADLSLHGMLGLPLPAREAQ